MAHLHFRRHHEFVMLLPAPSSTDPGRSAGDRPTLLRPWSWGLAAGVLSGIPPFSLLDPCFCPWASGAAFLGVLLAARRSGEAIHAWQGLALGARIGGFAGPIAALGQLATWLFVSLVVPPNESLGPFARIRPTAIEAFSEAVFIGLVWAVAVFAAASLGGLLGALASRRPAQGAGAR